MDPSDGYVAPPMKGPNPFAKVDENVINNLPKGCQVISLTPHGSSFWTQTAHLETKLIDQSSKSFFLKVALEEKGRRMMHGEFESMSALYSIVPDFVPKPHAWGSYRDIEDMHFFLCDFHDMTEELPDLESFTESVARLHLNSVSPNGKYGFHVTTYMGPLPQDNTWCDTWEEFFVRGMRRMLMLEEEAQGPNDELKELSAEMYAKVIPRLLRPLTVLNSIKPVLIHGDLWYGNCCTDNVTDMPIVFDACAFWAHNECEPPWPRERFLYYIYSEYSLMLKQDEVGTWRALRYRFGKPYINAYNRHFPVAAPREDHDDRNALYSIRFDLHSSCAYSSSTRFRRDVMDEMKRLIKKFPEGYEGWAREQGLE